ncbi:hypothetical protein Y032_0251g173 [Ancylostoma ceylanicum]|uniref:Uncharacterized protein n=1 Tax=Ancylostoma ceylanicum TaxID=53326 RepID=A0A016SCS2_9BILA|nr:hypothetical protein Y032_0251g173 [Ancylostoma ceylanicum]
MEDKIEKETRAVAAEPSQTGGRCGDQRSAVGEQENADWSGGLEVFCMGKGEMEELYGEITEKWIRIRHESVCTGCSDAQW